MPRPPRADVGAGGMGPKEAAMRCKRVVDCLALVVFATGPAMAQDGPITPATPVPSTLPTVEDPASLAKPENVEAALRAHTMRRQQLEAELRRIRQTYFRNPRATDLRQAGIERLRQYTEPATFEAMIEIFARSGEDVVASIIDHLASLDTPEALATIAWTSVFDDHKGRRAMAHDALARVLHGREVPRSVQSVVAEGLRRSHDPHVANAAGLAATLRLADAIPAMIASQVRGADQPSRGDRSLAYILVGQQQAFVSDLQPVVGNSAVAFDPELSVVTEGVVLRVIDAVVITYRVEVHNALVGLTSDLWGQDTSYLGWDIPRWRRWYAQEFLPGLN